MDTECLICFDPIRRPWKQPISCACRPAIHKYCWESWVNVAGEVCIICRADKYGYTPEDGEEVAIVIAVAPPRRQQWSLQFLLFLSVLWFLYLFAVIGKIAGTAHDEL